MATSAPDISSLIEVASAPDPAPIAQPSEPVAAPVDTDVLDQTDDNVEAGAEGAEQPEPAEPNIDARTNPDAIRKALRAFRDIDPKNAPIARHLNNVVGRYNAYATVFPKVSDAQNAKVLLDAVGGGDGLTSLQQTIKSVNETDALLYAGDGKVIKTLYDDFKSAGKQENFGKLASPFLDTLAENDPKAYAAALHPHNFDYITRSGLPNMLTAFDEALNAVGADGKPAPNTDLIKTLVTEMKRWYNSERQSAEGSKKVTLDPERQAFEQERTKFQTERQKAFQNEVNSSWNTTNAQALGSALKPYLREPFAKNWTDKTKASVANEIMSNLLSELKADKSYQAQMDAFWSESSPDKSKIVNFHKSKLDVIANRIVKDTLEARYPGFRSAPARPGAAAAKPGQPAAQSSGKPLFVSAKPAHDQIDWDKDPETMLFISGRAYLKNGRFVSWNPRYK